MTTPSGQIGMYDVNSELAYTPSQQISLNDTYVRNLAGASGQISMSQLQSRTNLYYPTHTIGTSTFSGTWSGTGYPLVSHPYSMYAYTEGTVTDTSASWNQNWPTGTVQTGYDVSTPAFYVTSNAARPQTIALSVTFFIMSHTIINFYIMKQGTAIASAYQAYNFNATYHSEQYLTVNATDILQPGASTYYTFRMTSTWNGDYDYSIGPSGFLNCTVSQSAWD